MNTQNAEFDHECKNYRLRSGLERDAETDAIGYWFAAVVVFAFLAAGIIVYRTGNPGIRTASNDVPTIAQTNPADAPPILQPR